MKKYCRYCAFCFCGDEYYCSAHNKPLKRINTAVKCDDFALSELGDVDTGKQYQPRELRRNNETQNLQITFKL